MTKLNNEYFTREEILTDLLDTVNYLIEEGESIGVESYPVYTDVLFNDTFNTDYYIIGTYEAKQALEQYGVFEALEEVTDFVKDLADPERLANILYYIKAEELCEQLGLYDEEELNHEQLKELKHKIEKELSRLVIF